MNRNATNAFYGVLDYASYPLGMLAVAPLVLRHLGAAEYGLWMVSTSIISAGGIIASGFSDAAIQRIATLRSANQIMQIGDAVRTLFAVNLTLACALSLALWLAAPTLSEHLAKSPLTDMEECVVCLRIASLVMLMRGIETVSVSTQQALQEYRGTVQVSTAVRILTLGSAAGLAQLGQRTGSVLGATAVIFALGTCTQFWLLRRFLPAVILLPRFASGEWQKLLASGVFVWLQAVGSVVFRQLDRIVLGVALGVRAVAPYSVAIQIAEPLFGLTASGFSFFFPYLSERSGTLSGVSLQRLVLKAFFGNLLMVSTGAGLLFWLGSRFLQSWIGPAVAKNAISILPLIVIGAALSGLSVTGTYAMQALGLFRTVACISLGSRALLLLLMLFMLRTHGLRGLAVARTCYGALSLLVYVPLLWTLNARARTRRTLASSAVLLQEGVSR
ncbi:lipopolysaccharide biosynthesis protein [Acidipila sp. EB88]|uniref:lipopolysaccharide biosynthesis protein n=1 Tax=Acidipila sp. EB88 TaxID=2305226 RepID=UPI000F5F1756|nr:oligosaccharide flippase family protein [Acidipila sp. EB88]RRA49624.1 polysaccharide biosynthesis protein [Acidipila sp. EB88]